MTFLLNILSEVVQFWRRLLRAGATAVLAVIAGCAFSAFAPLAAAQTIIVVDDSSTAPTPDGTSWATAYKHLQDAIAAQAPSGVTQIWVAAGTYKPDRTTSTPSGSGFRTATFMMNENLEIYGGFAGTGSIDTAAFRARNAVTNVTILSGEINDSGEIDDNSYHIVTADGVDSSAIIDGFTIRDAYASDAPELIEDEEETAGVGGGLVLPGGPGPETNQNLAVFLRLRFTNNIAVRGGAVFIRIGESNNPQFRNCVWDNNEADNGACVYIVGTAGYDSWPGFYNGLFHDNTAEDAGSVMHSTGEYAIPRILNGTLTENNCAASGAALAHDAPEGVTVPRPGGFLLINSIVWENSNDNGSDLDAQLSGEVDLQDSDVQDLGSPYPAPPDNGTIDEDHDFQSPGSGNNFRLTCGSPCINEADNGDVPNDAFDLKQDGGTNNDPNPDLDLRNRIVTVVDMGAYEQQPATCEGDADGNCQVDVDDLIMVILNWGCTGSSCPGDVYAAPCGSGTVDTDDLVLIILRWGPCPEPCTETGTGAGADPESYEDCVDLCSSLEGETEILCMQACFAELCAKGHTAFCE